MAKAIKKLGIISILDSLMDYRTFFDLANVMMVIIDNKQKIVLINSRGCEILGCLVGGAEGKNWFETFLPKEQIKEVKHVFDEMMKGKAEPFIHYENYVLNQQGEKRLINWHNTYLKDDKGRIRYTLSSGVDITDRQSAEESKEKDKLLKEIKSLKQLNQVYQNKIKRIESKLSRLATRAKASGKTVRRI